MNEQEKIKTIKKLVKKYQSNIVKNREQSYKVSQAKLKKMVDDHGVECVAAASGLTVGTVQQYIRVTVPPSINVETINQAEAILEGV